MYRQIWAHLFSLRRLLQPVNNFVVELSGRTTILARPRIQPDPIPKAATQKILEAGVCAPIADPGINKSRYGIEQWSGPGMSREPFLRLFDAAENLAAHIHEAP